MKTQLMMKNMFLLAVMALTVLSCANRPKSAEITVPDDLDPEYAVNLVKAGEKAPDFVLTDLDGKTYTLKDFRGKTVVVDFWATWCPDCREEIDDLVRIHKEHPEVEFLGISFDTDAEQLRKYTAEHGMDWLQLSEGFKKWKETQVSEAYGVKWIPTKYVISPKGKVLLSTVMTEKVEILLDRLSGNYISQRPAEADRLFRSEAVEAKISEVAALLQNPKLRWMFVNCFPNTLDTTVHFRDGETPETFVYTGDIHAMWLRDSGAQVWPYVAFAGQDEHLRRMLAGVINTQFRLITIDPYANAFNDGPTGEGAKDDTGAPHDPNVFERKWEIDSHCYPVRLAHHYWKTTGDTSVFGETWLKAVRTILETFRTQQRKDGDGPYYFLRVTDRQLDTKDRVGRGNPVKPVGLIASSFRPSDDATQFEFLIPSNFFAVSILRKAAEILDTVNHEAGLAGECRALADEVAAALQEFAVNRTTSFGPIYAFEADGFGNQYLMDDANVPSLLSLAYLDESLADDPIYQNTRRFVWSDSNPYFWRGKAAEGIGGPHIGTEVIWPMSIMMRAFTAKDDAEIKWCMETLLATDAGTGFIHESFHRDDASDFTRPWFAWQNTLFGELVIKLVGDGKLDLLNSIR